MLVPLHCSHLAFRVDVAVNTPRVEVARYPKLPQFGPDQHGPLPPVTVRAHACFYRYDLTCVPQGSYRRVELQSRALRQLQSGGAPRPLGEVCYAVSHDLSYHIVGIHPCPLSCMHPPPSALPVRCPKDDPDSPPCRLYEQCGSLRIRSPQGRDDATGGCGVRSRCGRGLYSARNPDPS
jgi:hypothetical protein